MNALVTVTARVDRALAEKARLVLAASGLTVSDIVRMMLVRIVKERRIPDDLKVPNAITRAAVLESRLMLRSCKGRQ